MTWVKLDDRFDDNLKVRGAQRADVAALGLYVLALTACARYETDGRIPDLWLEERFRDGRERSRLAGILVEHGLWIQDADGYAIHDYLEFNPSRESLKTRRERDRVRKASARNPDGLHPESDTTPLGPPARAHAGGRAPGSGPGRTTTSDKGSATDAGVARAHTTLAALETCRGRWPDASAAVVDTVGALYPEVAVAQAALLAVTWAASDTWRLPFEPTLRAAAKKLDDERETKAARGSTSTAKRSAALRAVTGGAA